MKNCDTCIYKGELEPEITKDRYGYEVETRYSGIRCTNKYCIYYRSPTIPLVNAGLDNCKNYELKKMQDMSGELPYEQ